MLTGSEDGIIRKYDVIPTLNGDVPLTLVQRHGITESVQKSGILISAWENEPPGKPCPIHSIDVHSEGVWCLTGSQNGLIHLWTIRHDEGSVY